MTKISFISPFSNEEMKFALTEGGSRRYKSCQTHLH